MNKQTDVKSGEFRTDAQAAAEKVELHEMTIAQRELWLGKTFPKSCRSISGAMGWLTGLSTLSCCGKPSMLSSKKRRLCKRILWKKTVSFINTARHAHMSRCSHSISVRNPIPPGGQTLDGGGCGAAAPCHGRGTFSFHVITLAPQRYVLYRRFHHMITDGRSAEEVMRRIAAYYNALASGSVIPEFANCNFSAL